MNLGPKLSTENAFKLATFLIDLFFVRLSNAFIHVYFILFITLSLNRIQTGFWGNNFQIIIIQ
jgi:hypothetical protein